jgi:hypothetical protein
MKKENLIIASFLGVALSFSACESNNALNTEIVAPEVEQAVINEIESTDVSMQASTFISNPTSITDAEKTGLYLMREEEKMARDVYSFFYTKFNYRVFGNITKSENAHTSAVLRLITYFGLTDPAVATVAVFKDPTLQALYNKFTTEATTVDQALKTGAFIEEYDIADLKKLIAETQNNDIKLVYGNLLRGSEFHLKAFTGVLKLRGIVYFPTIITVEEYNIIISKK